MSEKRRSPRPSRAVPERVRRALELLAEEARERIARHPLAHLAGRRRAVLEIPLRLSAAGRPGDLDELATLAARALDEGIEAHLAHERVFRPGHLFCLRCARTDCDHAVAPGAREIFAGYGPTGLPRWIDLGAWWTGRDEARAAELWCDPPRLVAEAVTGDELMRDLLPSFEHARSGVRIHGEVVAGWYRISDRFGAPTRLAVTVQVISTGGGRGRRRLGLNVLGSGPEGQPLGAVAERFPAGAPWSGPVRWAHGALESIERTLALDGRGGGNDPLERRIQGLLGGLARRLEKERRGHGLRTRHATERRAEGKRPTHMARPDLERAREEDVLYDTLTETLVVLGERGRTHFFNAEGRLVTSLHSAPGVVERRRKTGHWRAATSEEVAALRLRAASRSESARAEAPAAPGDCPARVSEPPDLPSL